MGHKVFTCFFQVKSIGTTLHYRSQQNFWKEKKCDWGSSVNL